MVKASTRSNLFHYLPNWCKKIIQIDKLCYKVTISSEEVVSRCHFFKKSDNKVGIVSHWLNFGTKR